MLLYGIDIITIVSTCFFFSYCLVCIHTPEFDLCVFLFVCMSGYIILLLYIPASCNCVDLMDKLK